jgi:metallo-beta-lactamase family protein
MNIREVKREIKGMKVKFIGATHGITGSCSWLHHEPTNTQLLVDCGGYIEGNNSEWKNGQSFPFNPREIRYVLLTHAHYDHCGLLPKLYKEGFIGEVYCTKATAELARIILNDSQKHTLVYSESDVKKIKFKYVDGDDRFAWGKPISLADNLRMVFLRSSHILGAASIQVSWKFNGEDKNIHFSGDIGNNTDEISYLPLLKSNQYPFPNTDYLVVESTYGGKCRAPEYKDAHARRTKLKEIIEDVVFKNDGRLIIPSFAMHRAQEIMVDLLIVTETMLDAEQVNNYLKTRTDFFGEKFKIMFDSSMLSEVCSVYSNDLFKKSSKGKTQYFSEQTALSVDVIKTMFKEGYMPFENINGFLKLPSSKKSGSKSSKPKPPDFESRTKSSSIIVASGGMCEAGPIKEYLARLAGDPKNAIMFTGYLSASSEGNKIKNGQVDSCKAKIFDMSFYYSGHADEAGLLDFLFNLSNREQTNYGTKIFINHGNPEGKGQLKEAIWAIVKEDKDNHRQIKDVIPLFGAEPWYDLNNGVFEPESAIRDESLLEFSDRLLAIEEKLDRLFEQINIEPSQ